MTDRELLKRVAEAVREAYLWHAPPDVLPDMRGVSLDAIIDRVVGEAEAQQPEAEHECTDDACWECKIWHAAHARGVAIEKQRILALIDAHVRAFGNDEHTVTGEVLLTQLRHLRHSAAQEVGR